MHLLGSDPILVITQFEGTGYIEAAHTVNVEPMGNSVAGVTFSIVKFVMSPCDGIPEKPQLDASNDTFITTQPSGIDWFVQIDSVCGVGPG